MSAPRYFTASLFLLLSSPMTAAEPGVRFSSPSLKEVLGESTMESEKGMPIFSSSLNGRKRLERANSPPERNVDKSPLFCFPDSSGFFGTVGDGSHSTVRYGFGLETRASADMDSVVDGVKGTIEHYLITSVFPSICGGSGGLSGIHGLYFSPEVEKQSDKLRSVSCGSRVSQDSTCDVYGSKFRVYGTNGLDFQQIITDSLAAADPRAGEMFDDVERVFYVNLAGQDGTPNVRSGSGDDSGLSTAAIVAIVICSLLVCIGIIGFVVYRRRRANAGVPNDALQSATLRINSATREPYLAFSVAEST